MLASDGRQPAVGVTPRLAVVPCISQISGIPCCRWCSGRSVRVERHLHPHPVVGRVGPGHLLGPPLPPPRLAAEALLDDRVLVLEVGLDRLVEVDHHRGDPPRIAGDVEVAAKREEASEQHAHQGDGERRLVEIQHRRPPLAPPCIARAPLWCLRGASPETPLPDPMPRRAGAPRRTHRADLRAPHPWCRPRGAGARNATPTSAPCPRARARRRRACHVGGLAAGRRALAPGSGEERWARTAPVSTCVDADRRLLLPGTEGVVLRAVGRGERPHGVSAYRRLLLRGPESGRFAFVRNSSRVGEGRASGCPEQARRLAPGQVRTGRHPRDAGSSPAYSPSPGSDPVPVQGYCIRQVARQRAPADSHVAIVSGLLSLRVVVYARVARRPIVANATPAVANAMFTFVPGFISGARGGCG